MNPYEAPRGEVEPPLAPDLAALRQRYAHAENLVRAFGALDILGAAFAVPLVLVSVLDSNGSSLRWAAAAALLTGVAVWIARLKTSGRWRPFVFVVLAAGAIYSGFVAVWLSWAIEQDVSPLGWPAAAILLGVAGVCTLRFEPAGRWLQLPVFALLAAAAIYGNPTAGGAISLVWGAVYAAAFVLPGADAVFSAPCRNAMACAPQPADSIGRWAQFAFLLFLSVVSVLAYMAFMHEARY